MKKLTAFLSFTLILVFTNVNAQVSGNYQYNSLTPYQNASRMPTSTATIQDNNEIVIEVNGLMNVQADNYVAIFNLIQVGETAEETEAFMAARISRFNQELRRAGIDTMAVKVDMISFVPKYEVQAENKVFSKTYNEVPVGFELQKNVHVLYKKAGKLDIIISAAAKAEVYDLVKVDYFIPSLEKYRDTLEVKCLEEIRSKSKLYGTIGIRLDTLKKVIADNHVTTYPQTRYFSYQPHSRPAGEFRKGSQSSYKEYAKPNSRFYAPLDYDRYDLVINPVVSEPVVQLSYSVKVKYFLKGEPKSNYYILTPTGEVKQFNPR